MEKFFCLIEDGSRHWFCVPSDKKEVYQDVINRIECGEELDEDWEIYNNQLEDFRLPMHISNYEFTEFRELR